MQKRRLACTEICGCTECENQQSTDISDCDDVYNDVESDDSDVKLITLERNLTALLRIF